MALALRKTLNSNNSPTWQCQVLLLLISHSGSALAPSKSKLPLFQKIYSCFPLLPSLRLCPSSTSFHLYKCFFSALGRHCHQLCPSKALFWTDLPDLSTIGACWCCNDVATPQPSKPETTNSEFLPILGTRHKASVPLFFLLSQSLAIFPLCPLNYLYQI